MTDPPWASTELAHRRDLPGFVWTAEGFRIEGRSGPRWPSGVPGLPALRVGHEGLAVLLLPVLLVYVSLAAGVWLVRAVAGLAPRRGWQLEVRGHGLQVSLGGRTIRVDLADVRAVYVQGRNLFVELDDLCLSLPRGRLSPVQLARVGRELGRLADAGRQTAEARAVALDEARRALAPARPAP